ncbi:methylamine utilization protein MauE [Humitalea rosea]|uniref:Methylamine utilization protein MauE n=1 Tax=Humitalea rosea TaxID=990373 RepID=A0A2W7I7X6_9PROT|nr:MauE/DoxX family redox-associated membrane protein [Humitalea rosea]PZW43041.1 methylamine utilization protein MauE [Humitalea rosea]
MKPADHRHWDGIRPALPPMLERREAGRTLALATLLAACLAARALGQLADLAGFADFLAGYQMLPPALLRPAAALLPAVDLAIALGLLLPRLRQAAAHGVVVMAMSSGVLLSVTLLRGIPLAKCACLGVFLAQPSTVVFPLDAFVLPGLALTLIIWRPGRPT